MMAGKDGPMTCRGVIGEPKMSTEPETRKGRYERAEGIIFGSTSGSQTDGSSRQQRDGATLHRKTKKKGRLEQWDIHLEDAREGEDEAGADADEEDGGDVEEEGDEGVCEQHKGADLACERQVVSENF
jgi:hypothetical protein